MDPSLHRQTILVTGAAGYIGSHTVFELLKEGCEVVAIDNCVNVIGGGEGIVPPSLKRVQQMATKRLNFYEISTLDVEGMMTIFKAHKIDVVIHFAALKAVSESVSQPLEYYKNNILGTINLLQVMKENNVKKLVFSSSATVYGSPQYLPIDENHPTGQNITNPYGQSKFMCEQITKDITVADNTWRVISLRYFNPVGAHESGMIGEDPKGVPNNLMPFISQVAVGKRPSLTVFGSDYDTKDGTGIRDYIHVVDLSKGHVSALHRLICDDFAGANANGAGGWRAYNLGTGRGVSVLEMVEAFSAACGKEVPYSLSARRPGDVATVVASCDLARKELSWSTTKTLQDMCEDTWRWQKNNPTGFDEDTI